MVCFFDTSIHSIFEGMALGLIKESSRAIHIFIGIILHECIVAVALGLNSFRLESEGNDKSTSVTMFGLIFSSTIPVGMMIGIAVGYTPGSFGRLISAIFQGLAAGTFLHVAFCELIPEELNNEEHNHDDHVHELFSITDEDEEDPEPGHTHDVMQENQLLSIRRLVKGSFFESKLFRISLIFLGFVFMAFITLFIDHND